MYLHTHGGSGRIEWPEGGTYMTQMAVVVEMWDLIGAVIKEYRDEQRN